MNGRTVLNVVLTSNSGQLDEVVMKEKGSWLFGTRGLGRSNYSSGSPDVAGALNGKVAGLYMNSSSTGGSGCSHNVVIGGSSYLTGSNQPFYVLDGVPIYNPTLDAAGLFSGKKRNK